MVDSATVEPGGRHGRRFLKLAAEIPVRTHIESFPLADANRALNALKNDAISGAAVLRILS